MLHVCILVKCSEQTKNPNFSVSHTFLYILSEPRGDPFSPCLNPTKIAKLDKRKIHLKISRKPVFQIHSDSRTLFCIISDTKLYILAQNICVLVLKPKTETTSILK